MCISRTKGHFVTVWRVFPEFSKFLFWGHFLLCSSRSSRMQSQGVHSSQSEVQATECGVLQQCTGTWALASSSTAGPWVSSTAGRLACLASQV